MLTPSDTCIPMQFVLSDSEPNIQTMTVGDLDLALLHEMCLNGTVRPLSDRREDLYSLKLVQQVNTISVI